MPYTLGQHVRVTREIDASPYGVVQPGTRGVVCAADDFGVDIQLDRVRPDKLWVDHHDDDTAASLTPDRTWWMRPLLRRGAMVVAILSTATLALTLGTTDTRRVSASQITTNLVIDDTPYRVTLARVDEIEADETPQDKVWRVVALEEDQEPTVPPAEGVTPVPRPRPKTLRIVVDTRHDPKGF